MPERYFGTRAWGAAVDDLSLMSPTPVGEPCLYCAEPMVEGDAGMLMWSIQPQGMVEMRASHRECFLRQALGSVGHQNQTCSCFGGTEEDPAGMTVREAARAACKRAGVALF
jgi:hypothetical protein